MDCIYIYRTYNIFKHFSLFSGARNLELQCKNKSFFSLVGLIYGALAFFSLRSYKLFTDTNGVWVASGIFPWSKGVTGVKWCDLDSVLYFTGFISWALKSHTIHIGHRYTKESEIVLTHMSNGPDAVMTINLLHQGYVSGK